MKILLISYYFSPSRAIGAQRWSLLSEELKTKGCEVTILSGNWKGKKMPGVEYLGPELNYLPPISIVNDSYFDKIKHPSEFFRSISYDVLRRPNWVDTCNNWFDENREIKFDFIIASFSPTTSLISGNNAKKYWPDAKLIFDFRDLISIQGQKIKLPFLHKLDQFCDKYLTRNMDGFITIGETTFSKASTFYNKPGLMCYNGIVGQPDFVPVEINKRKINISYFGTLSRFRNPWDIAKLLNNFKKKHNIEIKLNIFSKDDPNRYKISNHNDNLEVEYRGFVGGAELQKALDATDVFLVLENLHSNGNENVTGKIFEYLSYNKPIMAHCNKDSDIGNILKMTNSGKIVTNFKEIRTFFDEFVFSRMTINKLGCAKLTASNRADEVLGFLERLGK